jgi:hypothetical protein
MGRAFRFSPWIKAFAVLSELLFIALAAYLVATEGLTWMSLGACGLAIFGMIGVIDVYTCRIALAEDSLLIVGNLRRRRLPRAEVRKVTWAAGVGVAIRLRNGQWVKLPPVGNSQSLANAVRAWSKRE